MSGSIYVVSTYYHAFITCVKQLINKESADIMVTDYIPESDVLAERLSKSGLFSAVYHVCNPGEYTPKNKLDLIFNLHRKNANLIEPKLPTDFRKYTTVNIFHDDIWVSHYLKDCMIKYRLIEDGLDSFKTIKDTRFSYMETKNRLIPFIKRALRIGYVFSGYDFFTVEVEVNDKNGVAIDASVRNKLVEVPRMSLLEKLSENDINVLREVFAKDISPIDPQNSVLLLTQPICVDDTTISNSEQMGLYRQLVADNTNENEALVIKPHPRDEIDYSVVFPNAVVLNKNLPAEMLVYYNISNIKKIIGFNSTALKTVIANECICAKLDEYLKKIRRRNND